jgi:hypothetical protein
MQLTIARKPADEFAAAIAGEWHVDDEDKLVRSTYSVPLENLPAAQAALIVTTLEGVLAKLLAASESARSQISRIMERPKDETGKPFTASSSDRFKLQHDCTLCIFERPAAIARYRVRRSFCLRTHTFRSQPTRRAIVPFRN